MHPPTGAPLILPLAPPQPRTTTTCLHETYDILTPHWQAAGGVGGGGEGYGRNGRGGYIPLADREVGESREEGKAGKRDREKVGRKSMGREGRAEMVMNE